MTARSPPRKEQGHTVLEGEVTHLRDTCNTLVIHLEHSTHLKGEGEHEGGDVSAIPAASRVR
jgi:hypothetical protein